MLAIATHGFTIHEQKDFIEQLLKCSVEGEEKVLLDITLGELKQLTKIGPSIVEELQRETVRELSLTATDDVKPLADPQYWGAWICQG